MCLWNRFNLINQQPWSQCMKQHRTRTPYNVSVCKSDGIYAQPPMSEPETVEISYPSLQRTVVLCKRVILCSELLCFCYLWFAQYPHMKEGLRMERQQYATCFDGGFQNSHIVFFSCLAIFATLVEDIQDVLADRRVAPKVYVPNFTK